MTDDIDDNDKADDKKANKHKKKIEWMVAFLEKGLKKQRIENPDEARRTIKFLESLHDDVDRPKPIADDKKTKKKKKKADESADRDTTME